MLLANEALASTGAHVKGMPLANQAYALQGAHVKGVSSSLNHITKWHVLLPYFTMYCNYLIQSMTLFVVLTLKVHFQILMNGCAF